jgi:hypothetical protein
MDLADVEKLDIHLALKFSSYICKEIQNFGAVAKSYRTNGLLIYGEIFAHFTIYSIRKPFLIYDFATAPL